MSRRIYLASSLRNPMVPAVASTLRLHGHKVFAEWYSDGPSHDWQRIEQEQGRSYSEALLQEPAQVSFARDFGRLQWANTGVLLLPAGKSAHLELGYLIGTRRPSYVLFDQPPEQWDLMYKLAAGLFFNISDLTTALAKEEKYEP